jgi:WD40 repeat protein
VTCGEMAQHVRGRAASCDFRKVRPMRIVTGGKDDSRVLCNAGPPFKRVVDGTPTEDAHVKGAVNGVQFSSDGAKVVSVGADKTVALYDGKTMALISKLENVHTGTIYACAWNSKDTHILTCSADGTSKLISAEPFEVVHTWNVAELIAGCPLESVPIGGMVVGCTFIKDDIPVVVTINGELSLLPKPPMLTTGLDEYKKLTGHMAPIAGMAVDHAKGVLYTADTDGCVCQYLLASGKAVKRFSAPGSADLLGKLHGEAVISCLTVVAGGSILTAGWDDTVRMVDSDGQVVEQPIALDAQPNAMVSGTQLAVVMTVGGLVLVKDGAAVSSMISLSYNALSVCVSKDDSTIFVGGEDCKIHVYLVTDSSTLEETHVIESAHLKPIHALSLSNDQTKLASADVRDVCVWNLEENYAPIISKSRWCFHTQRITCLAWSPDDSVLASGGADDSIYLWSLAKKMRRLHYAFSHRGGVTGLAFLQQGWRLVSVGADSCVNQWDVQEAVAIKFA